MTYRVTVPASGHEFTVGEGETVLDAALRQGYTLPYGCRNGACGACKGKVLQGGFDHPSGKIRALEGDGIEPNDALFCQCTALSDIEIQVREIRAAGEVETKRLPCRVMHLERLSHDVMEMRLKLPETERLQFLAGQYIEFMLPGGRRRAFSLANAPHDDEFLVLHIRHVPGGSFTDQVFTKMKEKALLRLEGPHGTFFLREESDRPILMMGGGTGMAPLKGMLEHLFQSKEKRNVHLFWGVRAKRDLYLDDPQSWAEQQADFQYTPVLSEPEEGDDWQGATGWVHDALLAAYPDLSAYDVYMSGPPPMIDAAREAFLKAGVSEDHLYSDSFDFAEDSQG